MSLIDLVHQNLGDAEIQQISQQIGADPSATRSAVESALPMLVGGMARTAQNPSAASGMEGLLGSSGGLLGGLGSIISGAGGGGGLLGGLGSILGQHQDTVEGGVQQSSGLDGNQVKKLLMILGPIVMAVLAQKRSQSTGTPAPVQDELQQEAQQAQAQHGHHTNVGGILGKILNQVES